MRQLCLTKDGKTGLQMAHPVGVWAVTLLLAAALVSLPSAVRLTFAQETVTSVDTASPNTPSPSTVPGGEQAEAEEAEEAEEEDAPILQDWHAFLVILGLLVLVTFALWRLFDYLTESRKDYYNTVRALAARNMFPNPKIISGVGRATMVAPTAEGVERTFEMEGPGLISPDQTVPYKALLDGADATGATWSVQPPTAQGLTAAAATVDPTVGANVTVTASSEGAFILVVTSGDQNPLTIRTAITVMTLPKEAGDSQSRQLPFIGEGFGSIVGALVLMVAVVVLGGAGIVDSDVVGAIFGALAGYLFGVVVAGANRTNSTGG